jgi:hypothetical protein
MSKKLSDAFVEAEKLKTLFDILDDRARSDLTKQFNYVLTYACGRYRTTRFGPVSDYVDARYQRTDPNPHLAASRLRRIANDANYIGHIRFEYGERALNVWTDALLKAAQLFSDESGDS